MSEFKLIAMDTSKYVFTLHGVDERAGVVPRRELRRQQEAPGVAAGSRAAWQTARVR